MHGQFRLSKDHVFEVNKLGVSNTFVYNWALPTDPTFADIEKYYRGSLHYFIVPDEFVYTEAGVRICPMLQNQIDFGEMYCFADCYFRGRMN